MFRVNCDHDYVPPFSHSTLGGDPAMSQYTDSPAKADGLLEVAPALFSNVSCSNRLTVDEDRFLKLKLKIES